MTPRMSTLRRWGTSRPALAGLVAGLLALHLGLASVAHAHDHDHEHDYDAGGCVFCSTGSAAPASRPSAPPQPVCVPVRTEGQAAPAVLDKAPRCRLARGPPLQPMT